MTPRNLSKSAALRCAHAVLRAAVPCSGLCSAWQTFAPGTDHDRTDKPDAGRRASTHLQCPDLAWHHTVRHRRPRPAVRHPRCSIQRLLHGWQRRHRAKKQQALGVRCYIEQPEPIADRPAGPGAPDGRLVGTVQGRNLFPIRPPGTSATRRSPWFRTTAAPWPTRPPTSIPVSRARRSSNNCTPD